jgi:NADP-dependent 3-hydroxy acid dehydrogenase YdfG
VREAAAELDEVGYGTRDISERVWLEPAAAAVRGCRPLRKELSVRLQGATALVTGATSGIGQVVAEGFAREGAHVGVVGRNEPRGRHVVETIRAAGGSATFVAADLTSKTAIDRLVKEADETFGLVDILVNNAGSPLSA